MGWFNRHLNWSLFFVSLLTTVLVIPNLSYLDSPTPPDWTRLLAFLSLVLAVAAVIWHLNEKRQNLLLLPLVLAGPVGFAILLCLVNRNTESAEKVIHLSEIYNHPASDRVIETWRDLVDLADELGCPGCRLEDKQARARSEPWCRAGGPPDIDGEYCRTLERVQKQ